MVYPFHGHIGIVLGPLPEALSQLLELKESQVEAAATDVLAAHRNHRCQQLDTADAGWAPV